MTEYLKFKCPHCGCDTLEEVCVDVVLTHTIILPVDPDDCNEYGEDEVFDCRVDHYQCASCGYVLLREGDHPIRSEDTLREYLESLDCNREPENG